MITSCFMPVVSGSCLILTGSVPVMQAAVVNTRPQAAPDVTYAASTSSITAIRWPTFSCNSLSRQNSCEVSRMMSSTSGVISDPPYRVTVPAALITGRTPSSSYAPMDSCSFSRSIEERLYCDALPCPAPPPIFVPLVVLVRQVLGSCWQGSLHRCCSECHQRGRWLSSR